MKAHDHTAIPLCQACHQFWHDARGPFEGWRKGERRWWSEIQITSTQAAIMEATR